MRTTGDNESFEESVFAAFTAEAGGSTASATKAASSSATEFLRVAVPSTAQSVKMTFNPVSVEERRQTRELNRALRLGFMPPTTSTG